MPGDAAEGRAGRGTRRGGGWARGVAVLLGGWSLLLGTPLAGAQSVGDLPGEPPPMPEAGDVGHPVQVLEDEEGEEWLTVPLSLSGKPSVFVGGGFQSSMGDGRLGHTVLQLGGGFRPHAEWTGLISRDRFSKLHGIGTYVHFVAQVAIPVTAGANPTQVSGLARWQQTVALGRHAVSASFALGPRFDAVDREVGLELTMGFGYAVLLPPFVIPLFVEAVHQSFGAFRGDPTWGLRVTAAWPL